LVVLLGGDSEVLVEKGSYPYFLRERSQIDFFSDTLKCHAPKIQLRPINHISFP
jgi:hypothetical protein